MNEEIWAPPDTAAEQEVGRTQTGGRLVLYVLRRVRPAKPEISAGHRRLQDRKVHPWLQLGAELYGVPAMNQCQTVDELFDRLFFHRRLIFRTAKCR